MDNMAKIGRTVLPGATSSALSAGLTADCCRRNATLVRKTLLAAGMSCRYLHRTSLTQRTEAVRHHADLRRHVSWLTVNVLPSPNLAGPYAAGRWTGFQNCVGNFSGIVAPALTGLILQRTGHFEWAFAVVTTVALLGAASWFFVVGPVEPVVWHKPLKAAVATQSC